MEEDKELIGERVKLYLSNAYVFTGIIQKISGRFLTLIDERKNLKVYVNVNDVINIELIGNEGLGINGDITAYP